MAFSIHRVFFWFGTNDTYFYLRINYKCTLGAVYNKHNKYVIDKN